MDIYDKIYWISSIVCACVFVLSIIMMVRVILIGHFSKFIPWLLACVVSFGYYFVFVLGGTLHISK